MSRSWTLTWVFTFQFKQQKDRKLGRTHRRPETVTVRLQPVP
jgi:hypothetical protein